MKRSKLLFCQAYSFNIDTRASSSAKKFDPYSDFTLVFNDITQMIHSLKLTQHQENVFFDSLNKITDGNARLMENLCQKQPALVSIKRAENFIKTQIKENATAYRRTRLCEKSTKYVEPKEYAIGLNWKSTFEISSASEHHTLQQNTFQYVSIIETLHALFQNDDFTRAYMNTEHWCAPNIYEKFCCGKVYKDLEFFAKNPNAIQIQLAIDDFEVAAPLKTKTIVHKVCAIYMQIMNLPAQHRSKLDNIWLVALCRTVNLKADYSSLDNIVEHIVAEIKKIEEVGIVIPDGQVLKGSLICFTFDNLGGNSLFGFVESFKAKHFCRICEATREQCSVSTSELPAEMRQIGDYDDQLRQLQNSTEKHVKGLKKGCLLNNIHNFHILRNKTVDMMHDVFEGIIPACLRALFNYCIAKNILTDTQIHNRIRDHNYGQLNIRNKPSTISLKQANLNQSASQSYCLMMNTPFILFDLKDRLSDIWICVESLLGILQIILSDRVTENDLIELEKLIHLHLSKYIELFEMRLIPKQHHLTHYPTIIRAMGPLKNCWMMRMEAKHKFFTDHARKIKSRVNICKSLAEAHQKTVLHWKCY